MTLKASEIKKIAHLSALAITDEEALQAAEDFEKILQFVAQINQCETPQDTPLHSALNTAQPMRPDRVTEVNQRKTLQSLTSEVKSGFYIVPQFIDTQ